MPRIGQFTAKSKAFAKNVMRTLRENGSDITKPHRFLFYVSAPTEPLAKIVLDKFRDSGFVAGLSRDEKQWMVSAAKTIVPANANLQDHARFFEQIADAVGGEFDGWETEVVNTE